MNANLSIICRNALKPNGVIVFKENVTSSEEIEYDRNDSSVTRPFPLLLDLIKKANYRCIKHCKQERFPKALYTVYMIAIKPDQGKDMFSLLAYFYFKCPFIVKGRF